MPGRERQPEAAMLAMYTRTMQMSPIRVRERMHRRRAFDALLDAYLDWREQAQTVACLRPRWEADDRRQADVAGLVDGPHGDPAGEPRRQRHGL